MAEMSRRDWLKGATAALAITQSGRGGVAALAAELPHGRPRLLAAALG
jgi:hypothetical protein